jgi:hypothetical protein
MTASGGDGVKREGRRDTQSSALHPAPAPRTRPLPLILSSD